MVFSRSNDRSYRDLIRCRSGRSTAKLIRLSSQVPAILQNFQAAEIGEKSIDSASAKGSGARHTGLSRFLQKAVFSHPSRF